jgi:hypothetical protein
MRRHRRSVVSAIVGSDGDLMTRMVAVTVDLQGMRAVAGRSNGKLVLLSCYPNAGWWHFCCSTPRKLITA